MGDENGLSERELEILRLVATGASNKEIAAALVISPNTVKVHMRNIFEKIGAASRTEATLFAFQQGLVSSGSPEKAPEVSVEESLPEPPVEISPAPARPWVRFRGWLIALGVFVILLIPGLSFWGGRSGLFFSTPTPLPTSTITPTPQPRWQSRSPLPEARWGMAAASYEASFYLMGGETSTGVTGSVLRYDPLSDTWEQQTSMPVPVSDVQAAVLGNKIYVPGGRTADGKINNLLEVYDLESDRWEQRAKLPFPVSAYALVDFEGHLYLFGGFDGKKYLNTVLEYDPQNDAWNQPAYYSSGFAFASALVAQNKIFVVGGYDGKNALANNRVYYPQREQSGSSPWEERAPLPSGRYAMDAASLANLVYLVGGQGESSGEPVSLVYQPQTDHWNAFDAPANPPGSSGVLLPFEMQIHLIGGKTTGGATATHLVYQAMYNILIPLVE